MKLNLLKPLKRIFTALSGEEAEDKNLVSVMDKIADVVEENGSGGGNESSYFVVIATEDNNQEITFNKTYNDIKNAINEGKNIQIKYYWNDEHSPEDEEQIYRVLPLLEVEPTNIRFAKVLEVVEQEGVVWEYI